MIKIDWTRAIADNRLFGFYYYIEVSYYANDDDKLCVGWSWDCLLHRANFKNTLMFYRFTNYE